MSKAILIIGATGNQGGAVLRAFLDNPSFSPETYTIYAVTRNPSSRSAKALAAKSPAIKLVTGDLNDVPAIFQSLPSSPWGVFSVQPRGKEEITQGKAIVDEAVKAGVAHFVYTSVDRGGPASDTTPTDVPHFRSKHEIEQHLREAAAKPSVNMTYTILRPVFFLDNLEGGFVGKVIATAWRDHIPAEKKMQVIAASDIGWFGASAFLSSSSPDYRNAAISLAGDNLTYSEADRTYQKETGQAIPTSFGFIASSLVSMVKGVGLMFTFMRTQEVGADIARLRQMNPELKTMQSWAAGLPLAKKFRDGKN